MRDRPYNIGVMGCRSVPGDCGIEWCLNHDSSMSWDHFPQQEVRRQYPIIDGWLRVKGGVAGRGWGVEGGAVGMDEWKGWRQRGDLANKKCEIGGGS